jgi:hypothetical protein
MDLSAHTAHFDSETVKENGVAADLKIITETPSITDLWIHERT